MNKLYRWKGVLFILPSFIGVLIFYILPFCSSLMYCFTKGTAKRRFVGLENFNVLIHNKTYKLAAANTTLIIGTALLLLCLSALCLALLIEKNLKKYRFLQGWLLLPLAIPTASMVLIWKDLFGEQGIMNAMLHTHIKWLDSDYAQLILIGMIIWKNIGYDILLIINSLLTIPKEYEEEASLEGAGAIRIALYIKIPQLIPMLLFTVIISLFNSFKIFREVYLLQGDYPNKKIYLLQHFMNNYFKKLNYEMMTTAAFILYIVIFIIVYFSIRWQQSYMKENS